MEQQVRGLLSPPPLRPDPADEMEAYPVGRLVNDPANDVPGCVRAESRRTTLPDPSGCETGLGRS